MPKAVACALRSQFSGGPVVTMLRNSRASFARGCVLVANAHIVALAVRQVCAPELGWAELPAPTAKRSHVAAVVDEIVGNVWIKQVEQLVGPGDRKAFHGAKSYRF